MAPSIRLCHHNRPWRGHKATAEAAPAQMGMMSEAEEGNHFYELWTGEKNLRGEVKAEENEEASGQVPGCGGEEQNLETVSGVSEVRYRRRKIGKRAAEDPSWNSIRLRGNEKKLSLDRNARRRGERRVRGRDGGQHTVGGATPVIEGKTGVNCSGTERAGWPVSAWGINVVGGIQVA